MGFFDLLLASVLREAEVAGKKKVVAGTSGSVKALVMAGANSLADTCTLNLVPQGLLRSAL